MISYRKMPILRSAFQLGKQTSDHPRHSVSQISSSDETTNGLMCESMTKSCGVSNRNENSNIVEITASNPDSPVWDQTSDYFFLGKDQELVEVLHSHGCYESEEGMLKRRGIVSELETLVKQWIRSVGLSKGLGWRLVEEAEGRLLTYGSYRLGAVSRDGDIDVLCVAPEHVDRNDFFDSLYSLLEKRSEDITELRCLSEAFVPVIKMRFKGIEVDLTFASLHCRKIPNEDRFLQLEPIGHLDPRCHHSLNGYRATLEILDLVPDIPSFLVALRAVKLWAKKNGIYGNILGFPGGFSWAILVVKTCQENKGASPSELISRFFQTWTSWRWPEPVYIRPPGLQPHPAWNPDLNPVDASHCMPILTPYSPSNVTGAQFPHDQHSRKSPMWGVDTLPLVPDLTVPPPSLSVDNSRTQLSLSTENSRASQPITPVPGLATENSRASRPSQPVTNSNPSPSFATAMMPSNVNRPRNTPRRISESEIRDAPVPKPVNIPKKKNIRIEPKEKFFDMVNICSCVVLSLVNLIFVTGTKKITKK